MDKKLKSLTKLIEENGSGLNASSMFVGLERAGVVRKVEYESTTGSGEHKSFWEINKQYRYLGENTPVPHKFRTQCKFYEDRFDEIESLVFENLKRRKRQSSKNRMAVQKAGDDHDDEVYELAERIVENVQTFIFIAVVAGLIWLFF